MKLLQVTEQNKKYYSPDFVQGFNAGAKAQYEEDRKERHGRWIEEYSANHFQAKCSACGESTRYGITYDLEGNAYYMNYCPNCGAKMDEV